MYDASHNVGRMTTRIPLSYEIETFLDQTGVAPTTFGRLTVGDPHFVGRLRRGGDVKTVTADKVRSWMAAHPDGVPRSDQSAESQPPEAA